VALLTRKWLEILLQKRALHTFHLIPAGLLLVLHVQYNFRLAITVALIINLAAVIVFMLWRPQRPSLRNVAALLAAVLLYWLSGGAFLIFTVLLGLDDLLFRKRYISGITLLLISAILPVLTMETLLPIARKQAFLHNLSVESLQQSAVAGYGLYAFFLIALLCLPVFKSGLTDRILARTAAGLKLTPLRQWIAGTIVVLAGTGLLAQQSYNDLVRMVLQVNRAVRVSNWNGVLSAVQGSTVTNPMLSAQTNLALFQSGVLLDKMFAYPQHEGPGGLLMSRNWCLAWPEEVSNLCWKLGLVNGALHWGHEALETKGASADILTRLALVYMMKGMHAAAEHFLLNLKNIPFQFKTAEDILQLNNHPSEFRQTEMYKYMYACMPVQNVVSLGRPSLNENSPA